MLGLCDVVGADVCAVVSWWSHWAMFLGSGSERTADSDGRKGGFHEAVLASADRLPFPLAQPVWLVDVCGLSYARAATEIGVPRDVLADRLHQARNRIARDLSSGPTG